MKVSGISLVILVFAIVLISGVSAQDAGTSAGDSVTQAGNLHLQNPTTRRILEIIASSPEVSRKEIAGGSRILYPVIVATMKNPVVRNGVHPALCRERPGSGIRNFRGEQRSPHM